jgi:hypothetical protein
MKGGVRAEVPTAPAADEFRALQAFESGSPETLASRVSSSPAAAAGALKRSRCSELPQRRKPALADIIGPRRLWTVAMISSVSIPCR